MFFYKPGVTKTPTAGAHRGASRLESTEELNGFLRLRLPGDRRRNHLRFRLVCLHRRWIGRLLQPLDWLRKHKDASTGTTRRNHFRRDPPP